MIKIKPGQFRTADQSITARHQHKKPCIDCPFSRESIHGWLGDSSIDEWLQSVHGEARLNCHTISNQQCAGAAIYRGNMCKLPRDRNLLVLPPDRKLVFSTPAEFKKHHEEKFL
jgi:hypothetical protein